MLTSFRFKDRRLQAMVSHRAAGKVRLLTLGGFAFLHVFAARVVAAEAIAPSPSGFVVAQTSGRDSSPGASISVAPSIVFAPEDTNVLTTIAGVRSRTGIYVIHKIIIWGTVVPDNAQQGSAWATSRAETVASTLAAKGVLRTSMDVLSRTPDAPLPSAQAGNDVARGPGQVLLWVQFDDINVGTNSYFTQLYSIPVRK